MLSQKKIELMKQEHEKALAKLSALNDLLYYADTNKCYYMEYDENTGENVPPETNSCNYIHYIAWCELIDELEKLIK